MLWLLQGEMPSGCESTSINSALSMATTSSKLSWVNPFDTVATVKVQLSSSETAGTFSLLLPGVQQVAQQQQVHLQRQQGIVGRKSMRASSGAGAASDGNSSGGEDEQSQVSEQPAASEGLESETSAEDDDRLERAPPAGLQEAMGGLFGSVLNKTKSIEGPSRASAHHKHHQHHQPQVEPQQVAEVLVQPNAAFQLPVSFCPAVLRESGAELSVSLVSPESPAPEQLTWQYQVRGLAYMDAKGVKFGVKCKAKHSTEEVLAVPLPGLDPAVVAAIASAAGQGDKPSADVSFSHELIMGDDDRAALTKAVSVQQLDQLPVYGSSAGAAAADTPPMLRFRLGFAPHKAITATVQLAVTCSSGARWVYDIHLVVSSLTATLAGTCHFQLLAGCGEFADQHVHLARSSCLHGPLSSVLPQNSDVVKEQCGMAVCVLAAVNGTRSGGCVDP